MADRNPITGKFIKGNNVSKKGKRICANWPFCKVRINTNKYPNKRFCSRKCAVYNRLYIKHKNVKKTEDDGVILAGYTS